MFFRLGALLQQSQTGTRSFDKNQFYTVVVAVRLELLSWIRVDCGALSINAETLRVLLRPAQLLRFALESPTGHP
jgi:hypothetical protein